MKKILTIEYDALKAILESQSWLRNPEILGGYEELDTYELMRKIEEGSEVKEEEEEGDIVIDPPEIQKASKNQFERILKGDVVVTTDEDDMYVPKNFILAYAKERHLKPNVFFLADQYNEVLQDLWKKFKKTYRITRIGYSEEGYQEDNVKLSENEKDYTWFMKHCTSADNE